ncbi:MAG: hypothetical protein JSS81_17785 [Acidobacteria bacterium]|nr:hypothetical protein [Acidobacteriota bacterium]
MKKMLTAAGLLVFLLGGLAAAQKTLVPILSLQVDDTEKGKKVTYGYLLGGIQNGRFLTAKTAAARLKGDRNFSLVDLGTPLKGAFSFGALQKGGEFCEDAYYYMPEIDAVGTVAIGAGAGWTLTPRSVKTASLTDNGSKKAVADALKLKGLAKSPVEIKQAFEADLDGDGADETVLIAHHLAPDADERPAGGSYSLVMVRKKTGAKTANILVGGSFPRKTDDYFDGEYKLAGIVDLNGDGKMELVVEVWGYEENWVQVYRLTAGKPSVIKELTYYCGV